MNGTKARRERRKWTRLPLAIPVFVRSCDDGTKQILEFATALNVSAGGMLIATRRVLPTTGLIQLDIPSAPLAESAGPSRTLRAKPLRSTPQDGYYIVGLKFVRPLIAAPSFRQRRGKIPSAV